MTFVRPFPRIAPWCLLLLLIPLWGPLPSALQHPPEAHGILLDRHGRELAHFPREDDFRHQPAALREIPQALIDATLAAEDKRFFQHPGIDYLATARATYENLRTHRTTSGASTITQQLIKISSDPHQRTYSRKLREMVLARRLESRWSKDEILTAYMNRLDYGSHRQGCAAAARHFFSKPLADLSLAECALLAALPQAPSRLNPLRNPDAARQRRDWILTRLRQEFDYRPSQISLAQEMPLGLSVKIPANPVPHLNHRPGGRLSIDADLQRKTHDIITQELSRLTEKNVQHAALVVLDNATREVLAFHGSADFTDLNGGQINGALAPRSAGSSLKPFTYALAFQERGLFPGTIIGDIPTRYQTAEGLDAPRNYDRRHRGPVSLRTALGTSLNVPAMRLLNQIGGPKPLHDLLTHLNLSLAREASEYGLGLTIGNAEVSLLSLTNAYATLASLGQHKKPTFSCHASSPAESILEQEACYLVADILADNQARAAAFGPHSALRLPFSCAVKTGTSSDFRDNWCLGFTADFTVGVWVGNFDNTPMAGISGVSGAGPIFQRTMLAVHQDRQARFPECPQSLSRIIVDARTGHHFPISPSASTPHLKSELCRSENLPPPVSPQDYDESGRALLSLDYQEWFESDENLKRPHFALAPIRAPAAVQLQCLTPLPGATYYLDPELPASNSELALLANLPGVEWNSETLKIIGGKAHLVPGDHLIHLRDPRTNQTRVCHFRVEEL